MKIINPSVELLTQPDGIEGIYKQIEKVGRTCYKSEDKITADSAKPFVERMIRAKHYTMLEHGTVYLAMPIESTLSIEVNDWDDWGKYIGNPYSKVCVSNGEEKVIITTNMRVLIENEWLDDLQYLCEPTEHHAKRISLKFTTSIGVSREFNRHRAFSIAEQSTRYCNYSKEKFGGEVTFIQPSWFEEKVDYDKKRFKLFDTANFKRSCESAERSYLDMVTIGNATPQQAREVLPLCTATEVVYTAFEDDWRHFFDLRYRGTTGAPHPNALQVAALAHDLILEKLGKDL